MQCAPFGVLGEHLGDESDGGFDEAVHLREQLVAQRELRTEEVELQAEQWLLDRGHRDEDEGGARLGKGRRLLGMPAPHGGTCTHDQLHDTQDERVLDRVEVCKRGAAVDVEGEVRLKVRAEAHLANEGRDEDGELSALVVVREDVNRVVQLPRDVGERVYEGRVGEEPTCPPPKGLHDELPARD